MLYTGWCFNSLPLCKIVLWLLVHAVAWIEDSFITAAKSPCAMKLKSKAPTLYFFSWNKLFFLILFTEFPHSEQHASFAFAWVLARLLISSLECLGKRLATYYGQSQDTENVESLVATETLIQYLLPPVLCKTLKGCLVNEAVLWWFTIYTDLLRVLHMPCVRIHLLVYKFISHSSGSWSKASCTFLLCFLWIHQSTMFVIF